MSNIAITAEAIRNVLQPRKLYSIDGVMWNLDVVVNRENLALVRAALADGRKRGLVFTRHSEALGTVYHV